TFGNRFSAPLGHVAPMAPRAGDGRRLMNPDSRHGVLFVVEACNCFGPPPVFDVHGAVALSDYLLSFPFPARNPAYPHAADIVFIPRLAGNPMFRRKFYERAAAPPAQAVKKDYLAIEAELVESFEHIVPKNQNGRMFSPKFPGIISSAAALFERVSR